MSWWPAGSLSLVTVTKLSEAGIYFFNRAYVVETQMVLPAEMEMEETVFDFESSA